MKIHLGCGSVTPADWINVDASWNARLVKFPLLRSLLGTWRMVPIELTRLSWNPHVRIHDVRKPLPFHSQSAAVIYASHLLDCLYLDETKRLMAESFRVLKTGGIVRFVVEDVRGILEEYLSGHPDSQMSAELAKLRPVDRLMARLLCMKPEPPRAAFFYRLYLSRTNLQTRKWAYDADSLIHYLQEASFSQVQQRPFLESRISGIEQIEKNPGICVEGVRC